MTDRRTTVFLVALVPLLVLVLLGVSVRVPFVAVGAGDTADTLGSYNGHKVITVEGRDVRKPDGELMLTTVGIRDELTLFEALGYWLSSGTQIAPRDAYFPPTSTRQQTEAASRAQFVGSESNAMLSALDYLHVPTAPGVVSVVVKGPADGKLEPEDVITQVDGKPVTRIDDVGTLISAHRPGTQVPLTVQRNGAPMPVTVTLGSKPGDKDKGMAGITVGMVPADSTLDIRFDVEGIGGPSAGLMLALGLVDMLGPTDLTGGKKVAGTGEITPDGTVEPIGGIAHKLRGAKGQGASVFLVPQKNCAEAKAHPQDGLQMVKVDKLSDAVSSLGLVREGKPAPAC
ncbi:PDZ domain-containing protein [Tsukamurella sp. 8F]|uniref:YlbL family protein n=1 Tax=unclassified Tsukamurella TaxID=2633480 RepID=UPI0023B91162|nr:MULTISPECIES: PDZ domain-containing protein [unclassified Tsukamurella]MDF0528883.1 PDZ domain-containing protein [Tsukamurella sp. 8J]MDF0586718.1 PDZ domain-containing protein [Tsukamurella sp. 8F]